MIVVSDITKKQNMIVKVNRIVSIEEINILESIGIDIICLVIDRETENDVVQKYDSRAISLEKAIYLKKHILNAKLCIHVSCYAQEEQLLLENAIKELKPDFLNIFLRLGEKNELWYQNQIKIANSINVPIIAFGDGFGYDSPFCFNIDDTTLVPNLAFMELWCQTIAQIDYDYLYIKSEEDCGYKQEDTSDVLLETVHEYLKKINVLINDDFGDYISLDDLERVCAKGVTLSLDSLQADVFSVPFLSLKDNNDSWIALTRIARNYSMQQIIDITKKVKQ